MLLALILLLVFQFKFEFSKFEFKLNLFDFIQMFKTFSFLSLRCHDPTCHPPPLCWFPASALDAWPHRTPICHRRAELTVCPMQFWFHPRPNGSCCYLQHVPHASLLSAPYEKSGLDPHMINKLEDGYKSHSSYFLWSCWVPTISVLTLAYCCSEGESKGENTRNNQNVIYIHL